MFYKRLYGTILIIEFTFDHLRIYDVMLEKDLLILEAPVICDYPRRMRREVR